MQAYSNLKRASDPYALPDVEVFQLTAAEAVQQDEDLMWEAGKRFPLMHMNSRGWIICRYLGTCDGKELAGKPIWDFVFPTRKAAESYWYDSAPGCNDRCTYVKVEVRN